METLNNVVSKNCILNELSSFSNSDISNCNSLFGIQYTKGIERLTELTKCDWFITDAIVILEELSKSKLFVVVDLKIMDKFIQVIYSDGANKTFFKQDYPETNFPLKHQRLFFCDGVLMLPNEYL